MRKAMLLLAVFGLTGSLWAADLTLGTWKLNLSKSKIPPNSSDSYLLKGAVLVKRAVDDQNELVFTITQSDGSTTTKKYTCPQTGGVLQGDARPKGMVVIQTTISPGEFYETAIQDGKQIGWQHGVVSKDGRTITETKQGIDAKGKPIETIKIWDKQ